MDGLGDVQREQAKYDEAEVSYSQVLSIYKRISDDLGPANTLLELGDVQMQWLQHMQAESSYSRALAIYERAGNDLGHGNALMGLGCPAGAVESVQGEVSYKYALEIFDRIGNYLGRSNALDGIHITQRQRSKHDKAEAAKTSFPAPAPSLPSRHPPAMSLSPVSITSSG